MVPDSDPLISFFPLTHFNLSQTAQSSEVTPFSQTLPSSAVQISALTLVAGDPGPSRCAHTAVSLLTTHTTVRAVLTAKSAVFTE